MTEVAQPKRPISSATQPPSELPATCGRSTPFRRHSSYTARARFAAVGSSPSGSGGAAPKPGMSTACTSRSASSSGITGSQMLRVPPSPWMRSRGSDIRGAELTGHMDPVCSDTSRAPGLANSACTSPIRRSRKPASEEER